MANHAFNPDTQLHARMAHKLRKRQAVDDEDETTTARARRPLATTSEADEDAVTLAPGRGSALSTTAADDEETTTSAARARTTAVRTTARSSTVEETTSTTEEETSTTPSSTTTRTTATPTTTRTTAARTPLTTTPTTTSASRTTSAISSSATSGIGDSTSSDNANSDASSGGSSNGGTIAGVIIAVLAVLAIAAFFAWRFWKKKKAAKGAGDIGDTFYPYGGVGGGTKNNNVGSGNGYNQQIDSYEDLASVANPNGEKNNGGYGTIGNEHNNEKYPAAGLAPAGMPGMNRQLSAEQENFAGRGLSPYNSFNSFPSQTMTSLISPTSPPMNGNNQAFGNNGGNDSYPPTPQHYSQQGSIFAPSAYGSPSMGSGAPNAAMMNGHQSMASDGGFGGGDHLPHHQDRALSSAMDAYNGNGNGNAAALGAAAAAGAGTVASPFADPASEGKTYIVTRTFEPSMPDELLIYPGDRVQIVVPYDDGWCLGVNLSSSQRDNAIPQQQQAVHKGVFPQDCVEEWSQELEDMMLGAQAGAGAGNGALATVAEGAEDEQQQQQEMLSPGAHYGHNGQLRPTSVNSNMPLAENANLQRAPTLPPLDMGDNSRFSMTSGGNNNNNKRISHISNTSGRPTSLIPGYSAAGVPLPASIKSPMSGNASLASRKDDDDNESLDPYGGVAAAGDLTSPTTRGFAPDIQVQDNDDNDHEERRKEFGSSYHIADYASRLGEDAEDTVPSLPAQQQKRTSTALSERRGEEDFPSTPRTMSISAAPSSSSPRFSGVPTLSSADNNAIPRSPAAPNNNSRLSVAPSLAPSGNSRLSVAKSLKRTSSLVAPQDAETFIAPANGTPEMMPLPLSATSAQFDFHRRSANLS